MCAGIEREYEDKVNYWPAQLGAHNFSPRPPAKPEPYAFSFVSVDGEPVFLLGPVQGDAVDHTLFWVPGEKTLIAGDAVYARSNHVWYACCSFFEFSFSYTGPSAFYALCFH